MRKMEEGIARARDGAMEIVNSEGARELETRPLPAGLDIERLRPVSLNRTLLENNRIVADDSFAAGNAYKMLRTRVLQQMRLNGWKSLAVTGTCPEEGKSLTAINLSLNLARGADTSVVLVDLDLRKPSLHRHLGIKPRYGVGDYLRGAAELENVGYSTAFGRLGLLLNRSSCWNSSEMLSSPRAGTLVERLKQGEGRIAVFDMPPVLVSDDVLAFCPYVDAVLLVLAEGKTRYTDLAAARDMLQGINILGAVLNYSSDDAAPYYYYGRR